MPRIASTLSLLCICFSLSMAQQIQSGTEADPIAIDIKVSNESSKHAMDGTAEIIAIHDKAPYSYAWSNGETSSRVENLAPGTYHVTITDETGYRKTADVLINPFGCLELMLEASIQQAQCFGACDGAITILDVIHGNPPYTYDWDNGDGDAMNDLLCAGQYSVTVTDVELCVVSATYDITQPTEIISNISGTDETIAGSDGTAWVDPIGGTAPYTYLWNTGATDSLITNLVAGTYNVTITDATGCAIIDSVQVDAYQCFQIILDEVQDVSCYGMCNGLIFAPIQGGVGPFTYSWSNGDTSNIVFDLCAGPYSVTVTDLGQPTCSGNSIDILITKPDTFFQTIDLVVHRTDSTDGSIDISIHGGVAPYFQSWSGPNGYNSLNEDISGLEPGLYVLHLFDSNDCEVIDTIEILDMTVGIPTLPDGVVSIYPNPATDYVYVDTRLPGDFEVSLFSSAGTMVGTWSNTSKIDVKDLAPGVYVVAFRNGVGRYVERVIIK